MPERAQLFARAAICAVLPKGEAPPSILLIPAGRVESRDSRPSWLNDKPEQAISASDALEMTAGLPIDYDHGTDLAAPKGLPAPAAGWIKKLRVQDGAIWGDVEWTEPGAKAVAQGEWKYISPVFDYDKKSRRITCVLRAALTNNPALFDTAIASNDGINSIATEDDMDGDEFKKKMAAMCGLKEDCSFEDLHDAAKKRLAAKPKGKAKAADDDAGEDDGEDDAATASRLIATGKVVSQDKFAEALTELNTLKSARARDLATAKVDAAITRDHKLLVSQRDWAIGYCMNDEKGFDEFLSKQVPMHLDRETVRGTPTPGKDGEPALTHAERQVVNYLTSVTPAEMVAARGKPLKLTVKPTFGKEINLSKGA